MEREIKLQAKDFSNFRRALSTLRGICNDVDIKGGILRQRLNDRTYLFQMDFTPLISDADISMYNLAGKLNLLNALSKQEVQITIADNEIYFSRKRSRFKFKKTNPSFLDNTFVSSEELFNIVSFREKDLVLEHLITKDVSNLMMITANQFYIVAFQMFFDGNTATITASTVPEDEHCEIEYGIPIKKPLKGYSPIVITPFLLDHDGDMLFKMYDVGGDQFINKFMLSIGKISVVVYGRSKLMEKEGSPVSKEHLIK